MIEYNILRDLTIKAIILVNADSQSPSRTYPRLDYSNICKAIGKQIIQNKLFTSEDEQRNVGIEIEKLKFDNRNIGDENKQTVKFILWDLIQESALLIENIEHFDFHLTEVGKSIIDQQIPPYYDPEGYIDFLKSQTPKIDKVIKEYVMEGLSCYRQRLFFATAVMFGAAAEKTLLLLLESIGNAETDQGKKRKIKDLLDYPKISEIIVLIRTRLEELIDGKKKPIPYKFHEGCINHIISLYEMIRVQRNNSTHPKKGKVNWRKVFLTIKSFPEALVVTYRLINWFKRNKI